MITMHGGLDAGTSAMGDAYTARDAGFDGVELRLEKCFREVPDRGVPMLGTIEVLDRVYDGTAVRAAAVLATYTGSRFIQVFSRLADAERLEVALRRMTYSLRPGVSLAFEPVGFSPLSFGEQVAAALAVSRVKLVLDTWHLYHLGCPDLREVPSGVVAYAHLGDGRAGGSQDTLRTVAPGDGVLPLEHLVAAIRDTGFRGPWGVEVLGGGAALAPLMQRRARELLR